MYVASNIYIFFTVQEKKKKIKGITFFFLGFFTHAYIANLLRGAYVSQNLLFICYFRAYCMNCAGFNLEKVFKYLKFKSTSR